MKYKKQLLSFFVLSALLFSTSVQAFWNPFAKEAQAEAETKSESQIEVETNTKDPEAYQMQGSNQASSKVRLSNAFFDDNFWVWDDPFDTMRRFEQRHNQMMQLFFEDELFSTPQMVGIPTRNYGMSVDVSEKDDAYIVQADTVGFEPEDISIRLEEEQKLILRGERKAEKEESNEAQKYYLRERSFGKFAREFYLPEKVDEANIKAMFEDGALTITLPKQKIETEASQEIEIEVK